MLFAMIVRCQMLGMWMISGGFGGFWSNSAFFDAFSVVDILAVSIGGLYVMTMGVVGSQTVYTAEFSKALPLLVWLM